MRLAQQLERDRMRYRERRLQLVLRELRARARASPAGSVPGPLAHAMRDFEHELAAVRARLARHPVPGNPGHGAA